VVGAVETAAGSCEPGGREGRAGVNKVVPHYCKRIIYYYVASIQNTTHPAPAPLPSPVRPSLRPSPGQHARRAHGEPLSPM